MLPSRRFFVDRPADRSRRRRRCCARCGCAPIRPRTRGRHRVARRRRVGAQRAQPRALGRVAHRRLESGLHRARSSPRSNTPRSRASASARGRRGRAGRVRLLAAVAADRWACTRSPAAAPALIGGALLATNYVFVMWNRAALMESTMTAFIVASWAAYALAERRPAAGARRGRGACWRCSPRPRRRSSSRRSSSTRSSRDPGRSGALPRARDRRRRRRPTCARPGWTLGGARDRGGLVVLAASSCRTGPSTSSTTGR